MLSLFFLALQEQRWRDGLTWSYALAGPVVGEPPAGAIPTHIRPVPLDNFPEQAQLATDALESKLIAVDGISGEPVPAMGQSKRTPKPCSMAEIPGEATCRAC